LEVKEAAIHPALIPSVIPSLVAFVSLLRGDLPTFLVEVVGILSVFLGILAGQRIKNRTASAISFFLLLLLSLMILSSFFLAGCISAFISVLLIILLVRLELISSDGDMLLLSLLVLMLGGSLVLYVFLTGYPPRWRSDVQIPLALSLGLALIFISYPRTFYLMHERRGVILTLITSVLAFMSGFRADLIFILVEFFVICLVKRRYKELSATLPIFLVLLLIYGILRPGAYDLLKRVESISLYLGDIVRYSIPWGIARHPLWIFTTRVHPSQFIGRAFFGRSTGITLTLFGNLMFDAGLPELFLLSFLIGIAGGHIYSRRDLHPYDYAIYLAIMTVSSDAGLTQLFLLMIPALMLHESLLSWRGIFCGKKF
jgi:hypothetical protein